MRQASGDGGISHLSERGFEWLGSQAALSRRDGSRWRAGDVCHPSVTPLMMSTAAGLPWFCSCDTPLISASSGGNESWPHV